MSDQPDPTPQPDPPPPPPPQPEPAAQSSPAEPPLTEEEARAKTRGAQVVLDPDSPAAIAAKGGAGRTILENMEVRDAALIEEGLDPKSPSAELTDKPVDPPPPA